MLTIHQEETPEGFLICRPVGELDAFTVSQFRQALAELASSRRLVIDMSGIPFVDSAGLGALIGGIRRTASWAGTWRWPVTVQLWSVCCGQPVSTGL